MQLPDLKKETVEQHIDFAWDTFTKGFGTYTSLGDAQEKAHAIMKDFDVIDFLLEEEIDEKATEYWNEYWSKYQWVGKIDG